jgi:hypothetical protein
MSYRIKSCIAAVALVFLGQAIAQTPAVKPVRIRGEIVAVAADSLTVHRRSGDTVTIAMKADLAVGAVKNIKLSDIKPGAFIGTAATTGTDGKLTAVEVLVFPEAGRGTGEGHYDWDFGATSTMTNANVDAVVEGSSGRDLKLSYKGGNNSVTVPENVPIVTFTGATRADLIVGKKVFIVATPVDATKFDALRVVVEKDGVVPPM